MVSKIEEKIERENIKGNEECRETTVKCWEKLKFVLYLAKSRGLPQKIQFWQLGSLFKFINPKKVIFVDRDI